MFVVPLSEGEVFGFCFWIGTIISKSVHWGNVCCTTMHGGSCNICGIWPSKLRRILWSCGVSDADWTDWYISGINSINPQGEVNGFTCCRTPKTRSLQDHHTLPKRDITQRAMLARGQTKANWKEQWKRIFLLPSFTHLWLFAALNQCIL